jgi:uncharacterized protein (DUF885 family)
MKRIVVMTAGVIIACTLFLGAQQPQWVAVSNSYTKRLMDVEMKYTPEGGSEEGLAEYDERVSQPTLANEDAERKETAALIAEFKAAIPRQTDRQVAQDLEIIVNKVELRLKRQDYARNRKVPYLNASGLVFGGVRMLLDEQTPAARRQSAVSRLRRYAGLDPGYQPLTETLKQRAQEQMAKPGVTYPSRTQIETEMGRNSNYIEGIATLLTKYDLKGWEEPVGKLKAQLAEYDEWIRRNLLPKARTDFRISSEEYALNLLDYGIDVTPQRLIADAHKAFTDIQNEMKPLAEQIARQRKLTSSDYREVIRALKKEQVVGEAILPLYEDRLKQVETVIEEHQLVTLPERPARIRIASAAETAQQPAPHMVAPPFLNNTGEKGEFVLPLNVPAGPGQKAAQYDDFSFDAAAWTLIAHEARPGHELQFDAMLERGVSLARVQYAFNSTNVEGWGLYSEYITRPYMPADGQLISLDYRLLRAARMFLDPELQMGKITPEDAYRVLEQDVVASRAFAQQEVERYTYRAPAQATSYYYGYSKLLALRKEVETVLGPKFNQKKFHDFILAQGLLPPDLMRQAVMEEFVPKQ